MRKIDLIVIHCSATRENTDYSPEQLESDHKARGFLRAGYNFYIRKSGEVVNLRPLEQIPAHARGHNKHSIGICYEGGLDITGQPRDTRTQMNGSNNAPHSTRYPNTKNSCMSYEKNK